MDELNLDIRHFKLANGESLIGLVSVKNETNYIVERPVLIERTVIGTWTFSPWFPFSETKVFKLKKDHIIQHVPVADDVKQNYVQFALKMSEAQIASPQERSELEQLKEYEQQLYDKYVEDNEDQLSEYTDEEITIH